MSALQSRNEKVHAALLQYLLKKCASKEWIFDVVIDQLTQEETSIKDILEHLKRYNWEKEYNQEYTADKIIASIKYFN